MVNIMVGLRFRTRDTDACGAPSTAGALSTVKASGSLRMSDAVSSPKITVTGGYPCCGMYSSRTYFLICVRGPAHG
jgi:hypothetical protein